MNLDSPGRFWHDGHHTQAANLTIDPSLMVTRRNVAPRSSALVVLAYFGCRSGYHVRLGWAVVVTRPRVSSNRI